MPHPRLTLRRLVLAVAILVIATGTSPCEDCSNLGIALQIVVAFLIVYAVPILLIVAIPAAILAVFARVFRESFLNNPHRAPGKPKGPPDPEL